MKPKRQDDFLVEFNALANRIATLERRVQSPQLITDGRLPENPYDGQQVVVLISNSLGIKWVFEYREASEHECKWECIGGTPLYQNVDAESTTNSTAYIDLSGPSIVVPFAGEYIIEAGAESWEDSPYYDWRILGLYTNGAVEEWAVSRYTASTSATDGWGTMSRKGVRDIDAPNSIIKTQVRVSSANTAHYRRRYLYAVPVRVK